MEFDSWTWLQHSVVAIAAGFVVVAVQLVAVAVEKIKEARKFVGQEKGKRFVDFEVNLTYLLLVFVLVVVVVLELSYLSSPLVAVVVIVVAVAVMGPLDLEKGWV